jgi:anaerobic magnesium-protoporphyrin IX monomethyl ester cyclase
MKKVLLINPPSPDGRIIIRDAHRSGRTSKEGFIWCQTQLAQIASMLDDFLEPKIYDCIAQKISHRKIIKILKKQNPKYVIVQVIPATYRNDMKVAERAKELGIVVIIIGAHANSCPEQILADYNIDFVVFGEVEITIRDLLYKSEHAKHFDPSDIPGIAFRGCKEIIKNRDRPFADINLFPTPRYDLLPKYKMPFFGRYLFIMASRGCPFRCIFCREFLAFKGTFRTRHIENIIKDIKAVKVDTYLFHSGDFTADKEWVLDFCRRIKTMKIKWACNTHLRTIDKEMAEAMKQSGCVMIAPGIESGNQQILDTIDKRLTVEMIKEKVNMLSEVGIRVWGYFVLGFPGETEATIEETIKLSLELPLEIAHFGIATPYCGTKFYDMCQENGWLKAIKWEDYDQNKSIAFKYPDLDNEVLKKKLKEAYWRFYFRKKTLKLLWRWFR